MGKYVGDNNGRYVAVQRLVYVGPGQGDYQREEEQAHARAQTSASSSCCSSRISFGSCIAALVLLLVLLGCASMAWASVQPPDSTGASAASSSNSSSSLVGFLAPAAEQALSVVGDFLNNATEELLNHSLPTR